MWLFPPIYCADLFATKLSGWYIIIHWSVLSVKNWIVVFKDKVTVKFQNFIESLSVLYFLYNWSHFHQTSCVAVLLVLLITKARTTKWVCDNISTVILMILSIIMHITDKVCVCVGGGVILPLKKNKLCFASNLRVSLVMYVYRVNSFIRNMEGDPSNLRFNDSFSAYWVTSEVKAAGIWFKLKFFCHASLPNLHVCLLWPTSIGWHSFPLPGHLYKLFWFGSLTSCFWYIYMQVTDTASFPLTGCLWLVHKLLTLLHFSDGLFLTCLQVTDTASFPLTSCLWLLHK